MDEVTKVLFVGLHRPFRSPSQRYRIEQFLPALEKAKIEYDYSFILDERKDRVFYAKGRYLGKLWIVCSGLVKRLKEVFFKAKKYDYIFVQREAFMLGSAFFEKQYAKKSNLIFDFDDAIWMLDVSPANKHLAFLKNPNKTKTIIQHAYKVVVGNEFLKNYALQFNQNVTLIPTVVDTEHYQRSLPFEEKPTRSICIGWSGSHTTIAHFKTLLPVLHKIKENFGERVYFKVIGDEQYTNDALKIKGTKWTLNSEVSDLEEIDIGVMPITKNEWSKGKCGLKGLVYMAMEIPNVMTDFGVNTEIIQHGTNGFLCSNEQQWIETLSKLITDNDLRLRIGQNGRRSTETKYSVKSHSSDFLSLFCK
jgi:glycosyltransferase involved in cell wall biosynthesis